MNHLLKYFPALFISWVLAVLLSADLVGIGLMSAAAVLATIASSKFGAWTEAQYWRLLILTLGILVLGYIGWMPHRALYVLPGIFVICYWLSRLAIKLTIDLNRAAN